jgi:hypothetical protein
VGGRDEGGDVVDLTCHCEEVFGLWTLERKTTTERGLDIYAT